MAKFRITTKDAAGRSTSKIDAPNEQVAAAEAQRALADMAKDELPNGKRFSFRARVRNESGDETYRASLNFHGRSRKAPRGRR